MVVGMQQGGVSGSILEFAWGEAGFGRGVGEMVEGIGVDFRNASA